MKSFRKVLVDAERGLSTPEWWIGPETIDLGVDEPWGMGCTILEGGLQDRVQRIDVANGPFSFVILPTRGFSIWKGWYRDLPVGWESPVRGPVHPSFVPLEARGGLGWLYGFDEWVVRCGLDSNGPPVEDTIRDAVGNEMKVALTLHGRIANLPARFAEVRISNRTIEIYGIVEETMLFGPAMRLEVTISTEIGSNTVTIRDRVTNLRGVPAELELLYHLNYGRPFLEDGARFIAPIREMTARDPQALAGIDGFDRYLGPKKGFVEEAYFFNLLAEPRTGETVALLRNQAGDRGAAVRFDPRELPCFTLWKNTAAEADGYVTGLEPGTNLPNPKPFERERGRVVRLAAGRSYSTRLGLDILDGRASVRQVEARIRRIQGRTKPKIHRTIDGRFAPLPPAR